MAQWQGTTYGNGWMHKWLIRLLRYTDTRVLYAFAAIFIVPVCLIVNPAQRITYRYFRDRCGMLWLRAVIKTYVNFYMFAQVVIDKFAMYAGRKFKTEIEGYDYFLTLAGKEGGFIQLSAHIGNYEIAGYTLTAEKKRFNALVFAGEKESVMRNRNRMFGDRNIRMIAIKPDMSHIFLINNALSDGETVSMPADRVIGLQKTMAVNLLGKEAHLPAGPFTVATMRGLPVIAVNVMKTAHDTYKIYVTPLRYDLSAPRRQQARQLADAYAAEIGRMMTMYPEQWYNYFDFWQ